MTAKETILQARITDAEQLRLYWRPGDGLGGDWILEDNAGLHATSFGVDDIATDYAEADAEDEWERIYAEVRETVGSEHGELCKSCGAAASECIQEWSWAVCDDEEPCSVFYEPVPSGDCR